MDDDERQYWDSGKATTRERTQFWSNLEALWVSIPDPSLDDLKPPYMHSNDWSAYESGSKEVIPFHTRRWKKQRKADAIVRRQELTKTEAAPQSAPEEDTTNFLDEMRKATDAAELRQAGIVKEEIDRAEVHIAAGRREDEMRPQYAGGQGRYSDDPNDVSLLTGRQTNLTALREFSDKSKDETVGQEKLPFSKGTRVPGQRADETEHERRQREQVQVEAEVVETMHPQDCAKYNDPNTPEHQRKVIFVTYQDKLEERKSREEVVFRKELARTAEAQDMLHRIKSDPSKAHLSLPADDSKEALLEWFDKMSKPSPNIPFANPSEEYLRQQRITQAYLLGQKPDPIDLADKVRDDLLYQRELTGRLEEVSREFTSLPEPVEKEKKAKPDVDTKATSSRRAAIGPSAAPTIESSAHSRIQRNFLPVLSGFTDKGKCQSCGYLSKQSAQPLPGSPNTSYFPVSARERHTQIELQNIRDYVLGEVPTILACIKDIEPLEAEVRVELNNGSDKESAIMAVVAKDRRCRDWTEYIPGIEPQEHLRTATGSTPKTVVGLALLITSGIAGIGGAFQVAGVMSMGLAHLLLFATWIGFVCGAILIEAGIDFPRDKRMRLTVVLAVLSFVALVLVDVLLIYLRAQQNSTVSANQTALPSPTVSQHGPSSTVQPTPQSSMTPTVNGLEKDRRTADGSSHMRRAEALYAQTNYPEALRECNAALRVNPRNRKVLDRCKSIERTIAILKQK